MVLEAATRKSNLQAKHDTGGGSLEERDAGARGGRTTGSGAIRAYSPSALLQVEQEIHSAAFVQQAAEVVGTKGDESSPLWKLQVCDSVMRRRLEQRKELNYRSKFNQSRLWSIHIYCDDPCIIVVGVDRCIRAIKACHQLREVGTCLVMQPSLGLAYLDWVGGFMDCGGPCRFPLRCLWYQ